MAIPTYDTFFLPILRCLIDGREHSRQEIMDRIATEFGLSEEDRTQLLPSGQPVFYSRVGWATTYLKHAELISTPKRAHFVITVRGREFLSSNPAAIDLKFLAQFQEFRDFKERAVQRDDGPPPPDPERKYTPEEVLENSYQEISETLASELLDKVKKSPWRFFENLVVQLLVGMGYGGSLRDAGQAIGRPGDEGIDGVIKQDLLGLDVVYIQAKKWDGAVGGPDIQKFVGALAQRKASKGVCITTSSFTPAARDVAAAVASKVVLIDGSMLTQLMIDHDIGVLLANTYKIKRIDTGFFPEE